jgi:hypothetical protein
LSSILEERTKYYENADVTIDLRGYGKDEEAGAPTAGEGWVEAMSWPGLVVCT